MRNSIIVCVIGASIAFASSEARAVAATCSDGDACTVGDMCVGDMCVSGGGTLSCPPDGDLCTIESCSPGSGCVSQPVDCNDDNPCTTDSCDPQTGECLYDTVANATSCDSDADDCVQESCVDGVCQATDITSGVTCDDGNACTDQDQCDGSGSCDGTAVQDGTSCGDDVCATCQGGSCDIFTATAMACDDGIDCTTNELCVLGACVGTGTSCQDDGDACTLEFCNPSTDMCESFPVVCIDGEACTTDSCDSATGCVFTPVTNGLGCDDGNECTTGDACSAGVCVSPDSIDPNDPNSPTMFPATTLPAPALSAGALAMLAFGLGGWQYRRLRRRR